MGDTIGETPCPFHFLATFACSLLLRTSSLHSFRYGPVPREYEGVEVSELGRRTWVGGWGRRGY